MSKAKKSVLLCTNQVNIDASRVSNIYLYTFCLCVFVYFLACICRGIHHRLGRSGHQPLLPSFFPPLFHRQEKSLASEEGFVGRPCFSFCLISFLFVLVAWIMDDVSFFRVHSLPVFWNLSSFLSPPKQAGSRTVQPRSITPRDIYKYRLTLAWLSNISPSLSLSPFPSAFQPIQQVLNQSLSLTLRPTQILAAGVVDAADLQVRDGLRLGVVGRQGRAHLVGALIRSFGHQ